MLELIRAPIKEAAGDVNFQKNFKSMIKIVLGQPYIQLVYKHHIVTVVVVVVVVVVEFKSSSGISSGISSSSS